MLPVRMTSFSTVVNRLVFYGRKPSKDRRIPDLHRFCTRPSLVLNGKNCKNLVFSSHLEVIS